MTLKDKISFLVSIIFSVIFGISSMIIHFMFSDFRQDEFANKLNERAISTVTLLNEIKENDRKMIKIVGQNKVNKIYNEKILIFNEDYKLIYNSLDDAKIEWSKLDLDYLKNHKKFTHINGEYEVYGLRYAINNTVYYVIISAIDTNGNRKLDYLFYLLITTYIIFTSLCWIITSYAVKRLLNPLDVFHNKIKTINENNLDTRIDAKKPKDEIDLLANEFNQMMSRIDKSYQKQKEFTSHASHELRTPIARITSQIENKIESLKGSEPETKGFLTKIMDDVNQLSELISSLLVLSKIESNAQKGESKHRIDEIIFDSIEKLNKSYPDFNISLEIAESNDIDTLMEVTGNDSLLHIALNNLLKNACLYSTNHQAIVVIEEKNKNLVVNIKNIGPTMNEEDQKNLFEPFMRGKNAQGTNGLGLGLRIVQRILIRHNASISYSIPEDGMNQFSIQFEN